MNKNLYLSCFVGLVAIALFSVLFFATLSNVHVYASHPIPSTSGFVTKAYCQSKAGILYTDTIDIAHTKVIELCKIQNDIFDVILSPRQQLASKVMPENIVCSNSLVPIMKISKTSIACVKPESVTKLRERGWTEQTREIVFQRPSQNVAVVIIPQGSANPESQNYLIPQTLTVLLGINNTVMWINEDDAASTLVGDDNSWTTGTILSGKSALVTFNQSGTYEYHGEPHPWKKGKIIVLESEPKTENSLELYKKKYDAVIEGKVLWSIGHKGYPLRLQYDIEPIKIHKTHPALRNDNTISFVGERDTATEIGKIAVFGLDYDKKDNYFRLVNRFILDSSNTGSEPKTENPFLADNQILTVVGDAPCAWMSLHQIPHNELLKRHDRTGANALLLKIDDDDINKVSHLKEVFVALENKTGFELNEYEKNAWVKRINSSEIEQQKIWNWLKDTFDSQYGKRSDDSFTSYFTYKEKFYQITWALC